MSEKRTAVAKANAEAEKKCGTRWKNVVPWHADADAPLDSAETVDSFAATHSDIAAEGSYGHVCPCAASADVCSSCSAGKEDDSDDAGGFELVVEPVVVDLRKRFAADLATSRREAMSDVRLSAPMFRGRRGILTA